MKRALITIATVGILAPTAWVAGRMHNMALRPQPTALPQPTLLGQPTPLLQPMALLEDMPVEPTVALLVGTMALPLRSIAVIRPSPLALVGRPMPLLLEHMPQTLPSRMNGTPLPAP